MALRRRTGGRVVTCGGDTTGGDASEPGAAGSTAVALASGARSWWHAHLATSNPVDVAGLRDLARWCGLGSGELRRMAWHKLVQADRYSVSACSLRTALQGGQSWDSDSNGGDVGGGGAPGMVLQRSKYGRQIKLDVQRSMWQFDACAAMSASQRKHNTRLLYQLLDTLFMRYPQLHYYQGLHDVASVVLLAVGPSRAALVVERLLCAHLKGFVTQSLDVSIAVLRLLYPLLERHDAGLHRFVTGAKLEPFFALPWVLTWFAHDVSKLSKAARLFDFFLVSHPLMSLYTSAAVMMHRRASVLACNADASELHGHLQRVPETIDIDALVGMSLDMYQQTPPAELLALAPPDVSKTLHTWPELYTYPYGWMSTHQPNDAVLKDCAERLAVASHDSGTHEPTAVVATRRLRWSEHGLCTKLLLAVAWMLALAMILFWVWVWVEPLMRHGRVV